MILFIFQADELYLLDVSSEESEKTNEFSNHYQNYKSAKGRDLDEKGEHGKMNCLIL